MLASRKRFGVLLFQLLISLNNFTQILSSSDQYEGDECEWRGKRGVCTALESCQSLKKELEAKTITFGDLENCAFSGNVFVACCTDIDPSALPRKSDTSASGSTAKPSLYFPLTNATSPTRSPSIVENSDSSENGNSIDKEVTTVGSAWRPGDDPFAAFEFRTTTARPVRDLDSILQDIFNKQQQTTTLSPLSAITNYPLRNVESPTTSKSQILDPWMIEAISNKPAVVTSTTTVKTTTTSTPRSDIGFIDLSKKRTTTTTVPPPIPSNGIENPNNLQTVWVVQDPTLPQRPESKPNSPSSNWNGGINHQQQQFQNWNGPIQQQQNPQLQPNWNRPIQQPHHHQNVNRPSERITVVVVEEEPNWNRGRGSRFRQNRQNNWNGPNSGFNVASNNNQQQFQTEHHTWNGNGFNQGRPIGNSNTDFVAFPVATGSNNQGNFGSTNGAAQLTSAMTQTLNPDNPFLKPILNSVSSVQPSSGQIIQLQPGWNANNNNRQSRVFQSDDPYLNELHKKTTTTESPQTINRISKRPAEVACDTFKKEFRGKKLGQKIIDGKAAEIGEFPHMAALGYGQTQLEWDCAGSLISDRYVLTAGHCVNRRSNLPVMVRMGRNNIKEDDRDDLAPTDIPIENITLHREYRTSQGYNDIALIKLSRAVIFQSGLHPACLYTKTDDLSEAMNLTIAGWGTTDVRTRSKSDVLQKATVRTVPLEKCLTFSALSSDLRLPRGLIKTQLCARDNTSDTCQGDSGGPLIIGDEERVSTIIGVTSFGISCATEVPGVYTRIASYLNWIESVVWPTLTDS